MSSKCLTYSLPPLILRGCHQKYLEEGREEISIAIVGRPNVGKSSILNRLIGEDRAIVSDVAGTTRDAIDALAARPNGGQTYHLIDTAGVRQKSKVCLTVIFGLCLGCYFNKTTFFYLLLFFF